MQFCNFGYTIISPLLKFERIRTVTVCAERFREEPHMPLQFSATTRGVRLPFFSRNPIRSCALAVSLRPIAVLLCLISLPAHANQPNNDLFELSFAELANIQVTSVSKKAERVADAAASVFVITSDDLRRSGATSLPEALRLAPNLQVAQVSAAGYTISARGFNSNSANKLLVLIDGRSVYTPLFSGVFWDVQDVLLEDVERIEVISGPGGTLWGTNAVNGVINIITRASTNTQGVLASAGAGNRQLDGAFRYGATLDNGLTYRFYGKHTDLNHTKAENGNPINDAAYRSQVGFRADWRGAGDQIAVQGNAYRGAQDQPPPGTISISRTNIKLGLISVSGANLVARWERALNSGARVSLQTYFDRTERDVVPTFSESLDIVDLQLQHSLAPVGMHAFVWGADYRYSMDRLVNSQFIAFLPAKLNQKWASLFAQDEMRLRDDLRLTAGARVERNDYTGNELLPSVRLAWHVAPDQSIWGAISRAVRAPSRLDRDVFIPATPPFLLNGGAPVRSELATVYELGFRGQAATVLSYSVTAFHTAYDHLRTQELAPNRRSYVFASEMEGTTSGVEIWGTYQVSRNWRMNAGFSALRERLTLKPGSTDTANIHNDGKDPAHIFMLRSSLDLSPQSQLEITLRQVAALSSPAVPAYKALDLHYAWRPNANWEVSITGQNLIGGGHGEFTSVTTRSEFDRSVYLKAIARF